MDSGGGERGALKEDIHEKGLSGADIAEQVHALGRGGGGWRVGDAEERVGELGEVGGWGVSMEQQTQGVETRRGGDGGVAQTGEVVEMGVVAA